MVYGLVYDKNPLHVPARPLGMPYMSLTCDWWLEFVNWRYAAYIGSVDSFYCPECEGCLWMLPQ